MYEFLKSIELRCAKVLNTATYIGIFATVATIGITCLINIVSFKASQIDVKVIDGHHWEWKYDHRTEQPDSLHYSIDEKGTFQILIMDYLKHGIFEYITWGMMWLMTLL